MASALTGLRPDRGQEPDKAQLPPVLHRLPGELEAESAAKLHAKLERLKTPQGASDLPLTTDSLILDRTGAEPAENYAVPRNEKEPLRLGRAVVTPVHPEKLLNPQENLLEQKFEELLALNRVPPPTAQETRALEEHVRYLVEAIGIGTYLHEDINAALHELAHQTVYALTEQKSEFTEAEYLFVVAEALREWAPEYHGIDPSMRRAH